MTTSAAKLPSPMGAGALNRVSKATLKSMAFHALRRRQVKALPRRKENRVNASTGRVRAVTIIECPPACGDFGICPVARPYFPGEIASEMAHSRAHAKSAMSRAVQIRDSDLVFDPYSDIQDPVFEIRPYTGPKAVPCDVEEWPVEAGFQRTTNYWQRFDFASRA